MAISESAIEQHIKEHGIKQLTNLDNTGLYCNSNHYSKKTKRLVIEQTSKWAKKGSIGHDYYRKNQAALTDNGLRADQ